MLGRSRILAGALAILVAALLGACGGEGETDHSPTPDVTQQSAPAVTSGPLPAATKTPPQPSKPATSVTGRGIPERPAAFSEFPQTIADYLTAAQGSTDCLSALLNDWGILDPPIGLAAVQPGPTCIEADTDGDGLKELVVTIYDPLDNGSSDPVGDVLVFGRDEAGLFSVEYQASQDSLVTTQPRFGSQDGDDLRGVAIVAVKDVDRDGLPDLAFLSSFVGNSNFPTYVYVVGWNGRTYRQLTHPCLSIQLPDKVALEDTNGDGTLELVLHGDALASWGAYPQRARTYIYELRAGGYRLVGRSQDPTSNLYLVVLDANEAFLNGDLRRALELYDRVVSDPSLEATAPERAELLPFAHFQKGRTLMELGDMAAALQAMEGASQLFPESLHGRAAKIYLDSLANQGNTDAACAAATSFVEANLGEFMAAWDHGYAHGEFKSSDFCQFAGPVDQYPSLDLRACLLLQ